jgi:hypothetical protein
MFKGWWKAVGDDDKRVRGMTGVQEPGYLIETAPGDRQIEGGGGSPSVTPLKPLTWSLHTHTFIHTDLPAEQHLLISSPLFQDNKGLIPLRSLF